MDRNNSNKKQSFIIITSGPTGCGKTGLQKKTLELIEKEKNIKLKEFVNQFNYNKNKYRNIKSKNKDRNIIEYKKYLIDDLVENSPEYKKQVKKLIYDKCDKLDIDYCINDKDKLEQLIKGFEKIYFKIRGNWRDKSSLDSQLNDKLENSIKKGENIVFETTGLWPLNWLMDFLADTECVNYEVILSYSLVEYCKLIDRNKSRTIDAIKLIIEKKNAQAPRLPDVRDLPVTDKFKKSVKDIKKTLLDIVDKNCIAQNFDNTNKNIEKNFCGNHPITRLLLYNNNPTKCSNTITNNFIFDSNKNKFNKKIIKNIIKKYMTIIGEDNKKTWKVSCPSKKITDKYTFEELITDYKIHELKLIAKRNGINSKDIVGKKTMKKTWATAIMYKSK